MIKHTNPTIKSKVLRQLLANELAATHKVGGAVYGDAFFTGYCYGLYNAYERMQQFIDAITPNTQESAP